MKKNIPASAPAGKLSFTREIVRRLADTLTDDQLANVEGGLMMRNSSARSKSTIAEC